MQLGLFFRKEVVVAFRRIQDIHVNRNLIQRCWALPVSAFKQPRAMPCPRLYSKASPIQIPCENWLYERMRGAKGYAIKGPAAVRSDSSAEGAVPPKLSELPSDEVTELLRGIRDNLASLADRLPNKSGADS